MTSTSDQTAAEPANPTSSRLARWSDGPVLTLTPLPLRELVLAAAALTAVLLVLMYRHILDGGFALDDWAVYSQARVRGGDLANDISYFAGLDNIRARPGTAVFWGFFMNVFGLHMGLWLAFIAGLAVLFATSTYALIRALGGPRTIAFAVGLFAIITPVSDTLRLWIAGGAAQLPYAITLSCIVLALFAFQVQSRRRAIAMHAVSLAGYAATLLTIESGLIVTIGAGALYLLVARRPWHAIARSAVDVLVLGLIYVTVTSSTGYARQTGAGALDHAWIIVKQSRELLTSQVLPFGNPAPWGFVPVLLLIAAALVMLRAQDTEPTARRALRRSLLLVLGGVVFTAASYVPYSFAHPYYSPLTLGMGNRTNGLASAGWAMVLVGLILIASWLAVGRGTPERALRRASIFAAMTLTLVGVRYAHQYRTAAGLYDEAYALASSTIVTVRNATPDPVEDATFFVGGQPYEVGAGIPVFNESWDLDGALKYVYRRFDVGGLPIGGDVLFDCAANGMTPVKGGVPIDGFTAPYGKAYLVDGTTGRAVRVTSRAACKAQVETWPRSPALPPA